MDAERGNAGEALLVNLLLLILAQPTFAQTVTETDFVLTITKGDGSEVRESTTLIPLLAGACYNWWLKLGKTKGELFRKGDLPLDRFVDDGRTLTLDELRDLEGKAFAKAGLAA